MFHSETLTKRHSNLVRDSIDETICVFTEFKEKWYYIDKDSLWSEPFDSRQEAIASYRESINETEEERSRRLHDERNKWLASLSHAEITMLNLQAGLPRQYLDNEDIRVLKDFYGDNWERFI